MQTKINIRKNYIIRKSNTQTKKRLRSIHAFYGSCIQENLKLAMSAVLERWVELFGTVILP